MVTHFTQIQNQQKFDMKYLKIWQVLQKTIFHCRQRFLVRADGLLEWVQTTKKKQIIILITL